MIILKRIKHYITHNILQTLIYMFIFVALFIVFFFTTAAREQLANLEKSLDNSVLIKRYSAHDKTLGEYYKTGEADKYTNFPEVQGYNLLSYGEKLIEGAKFYIWDEEGYQRKREAQKKFAESNGLEVPEEVEEFVIFGVTDSDNSPYFRRYGLSLSQGRPITVRDAFEKIALVSENFAAANGLELGDTLRMSQDNSKMTYEELYTDETLEVTIAGLFTSAINNGVTPHDNYDNAIILPETSFAEVFVDSPPTQLITYLKKSSDVETYVNRIEELAQEAPSIHHEIIWDRELYETVSKPVKELADMGTILLCIVAAGCVAVLLILGYMSMAGHYREWGVLLSLGRSKWRVLADSVAEAMCPVILGAVLAAVIGIGGAGFTAERIEAHYAEEIQSENEDRKLEQERQDNNGQGLRSQFESMEASNIILPESLNLSLDYRMVFLFVFVIVIVSPILLFIQFYFVVSPKKIKTYLEAA